MKKTLLIILATIMLTTMKAQEMQFSDSAVISLLTCSPGQEIYAKFGHSGIRINDPVTKNDLVFNYGIFSFNTENFYYKFIKGETDYYLGVHPTDMFLFEYDERNSMVWEQILNLTPLEKRKIIDALIDNYRPENRIYRYNYVFDNCATRPRDKILNNVTGYVQLQNTTESKTFRQWVGGYVGHDTWLKFGIDMVFGMAADKTTQQYESLFLPEVLMNEFERAKIITKNNENNRNLVKETRIIVNSDVTESQSSMLITKPFVVFSALLLLGILLSLYEQRTKKYYTILDSILLLGTGLAGIIVFYLMFISLHPLVKNNLNILWLNPFNIVAAVLIWIKPLRVYMFVYQIFNIMLLVLSLIALALSMQDFNAAVFPLIVLIFIRYSLWVVRIKHRIFRKAKFLIKSKPGN
ncbi:MAG: DUF4105 domain-containing protein [Bacteroidia bacterium]|jgi:hypothetical protein|nr:DUF4105 domain-containing protein [Paludibacter sp.]NCB68772.1 DUF4105 domain-containing protein [Bacteroidia bacterium]